NKPQICVKLQLAVFFCRLGSTGSLFEVCSKFGIGEGTCKKVHKGFEDLGGLKNIIGAVDRTHILMKNAPNKDSEVYFTRKKHYAIHCQDYSNLIQGNDYLL
ncbi:15163_t:CDS:2, partial [Funneliformis geosporum]